MQNQFLPLKTSADYVPVVASSIMPSETGAAQTSSTQAWSVQTTATERAVTELLARTQRTIRRRRQAIWTASVVFAASATAALLYYFSMALALMTRPVHTIQMQMFFSLLAFLLITVVGLQVVIFVTPNAVSPDALAQAGGTRAIPTLIEAYILNVAPEYRKSVFRALMLLLPQMQDVDAHLLKPSHRRTLNRMLAFSAATWIHDMNQDCVLAILKAYERFGDVKAVPVVKRLANLRPHNEAQQELQQAAQECLVLMQARLEGMEPVQTLLRASMPDTSTPDILLRPAASASSTPAAELLRVAHPDDAPHPA